MGRRAPLTATADGLSATDLRFVLELMGGAPQGAAYAIARGWARDDPRASGGGSRVARKPAVRAKIEQLRAEAERQAVRAPSLSREWITEGILAIAARDTVKDHVRLRAFELLGKVAGVDLFREIRLTQTDKRSPEEIEKELEQRLKTLVEPAPRTVEAEARRVGHAPGDGEG